MGFQLTITPIASHAYDEDADALRQLLKEKGIAYADDVDPSNFEDEFFEVDEGDEDDEGAYPYVSHQEVGWSFWSDSQDYHGLFTRRRKHTDFAIY